MPHIGSIANRPDPKRARLRCSQYKPAEHAEEDDVEERRVVPLEVLGHWRLGPARRHRAEQREDSLDREPGGAHHRPER